MPDVTFTQDFGGKATAAPEKLSGALTVQRLLRWPDEKLIPKKEPFTNCPKPCAQSADVQVWNAYQAAVVD